MKRLKIVHSLSFALILTLLAQAVFAAESPLSVMATLSRRGAKPGDRLELLVTVRAASHPQVVVPSNPPCLHFRMLRKPQHLIVDQESVWLFRYRVTPSQIGTYEIPPIQVIDAPDTIKTKPLFLTVSKTGEAPALSARELALGVDIPDSLSEEALKAAPQPTPRPTPSPTPPDTRGFAQKSTTSLGRFFQTWWNFPGK
jgi:hypothetical protein